MSRRYLTNAEIYKTITSYDLEALPLMQPNTAFSFLCYCMFLMSPNPAIPFGNHITSPTYIQFMFNYYSNIFPQVLLPGQSSPVHVISDF